MKTDGIYVLTQDIINPCPDKRYSRDWRYLPMWKAGMRFVIESDTKDVYASVAPNSACKRMYQHGTWSHQSVQSYDQDGKFNSLFAWLSKEPDSLDLLLVEHHVRNQTESILQKLLDLQKISLEDVRTAIDSLNEDWDKEHAKEIP